MIEAVVSEHVNAPADRPPVHGGLKLLGHSSTKITEKHYAPWIKGRQDRLDSFMLPIVSGTKSAA